MPRLIGLALDDFNDCDPSLDIRRADHTGSIAQQINFAARSYCYWCEFNLGYSLDFDIVRAEVAERVRRRGIVFDDPFDQSDAA